MICFDAYYDTKIFLLWNVHFGADPRVPPVAAREGTSKEGSGGTKDAANPLTAQARHKLNGTLSKMLSRKGKEKVEKP